MRYAWNAALKDLRRHVRDPMALLLWLGIPLVIGGMIALATGGRGGASPEALVLVADRDGSFLSEFLVRSFSQAGGRSPVRMEKVQDPAEGRARIEAGEGSAMLVIPKGFGEAVLEETPAKLELVTNPSQRILPGIVQGLCEVMVDGVFYLHRVLGPQLRDILASNRNGTGATDEEIARISVGIGRTMRRLEKYISPPVIGIEASVDRSSDRNVPAALLFLPGIVLMALLFLAQGLSEDMWRERNQGTLRRMIATPGGAAALLAGKLIAGLSVITVFSAVILSAGMLYLSVPFRFFPLALVWSACAGGLFFLLMVLIQLYASSQRTGSVLVTSVVFPLLMLGGSFFPSEVMPGWMASVGRWTPNGWMLERLKDIFLARQDAATLAAGFAVCVALSSVLLLLAVRRARRGFAGA